MSRTPVSKILRWAQWSQRKWNIIYTMVKYGETFYGRHTALTPALNILDQIVPNAHRCLHRRPQPFSRSMHKWTVPCKKLVFGHMRTAKAHINQRIHAVSSGPSLFANRITWYCRMYKLRPKTQTILYACAEWSESAHFAHVRKTFSLDVVQKFV